MTRLLLLFLLSIISLHLKAQKAVQPISTMVFELGTGADIINMYNGDFAGMVHAAVRYKPSDGLIISTDFKYVDSVRDKNILGVLIGGETDGDRLRYNASLGLAYLNTSEEEYYYNIYSNQYTFKIIPVNTLQFMGEINMRLYNFCSIGYYFTLGKYPQMGVVYSLSLQTNIKRK